MSSRETRGAPAPHVYPAVVCHGNGDDHCCYVGGEVCEFLEEGTAPGRRWVCGLLRELGSWDAVHADPRYLAAPVARLFVGEWSGFGCGDWPQRIPAAMANPAGKCCFAGER